MERKTHTQERILNRTRKDSKGIQETLEEILNRTERKKG